MTINPIEKKAVMNLDFTNEELKALNRAYWAINTLVIKAQGLDHNGRAKFVIDYESGGTYTYSLLDLCTALEVLDGFLECNGGEKTYLEAPLDNEPIE